MIIYLKHYIKTIIKELKIKKILDIKLYKMLKKIKKNLNIF
jgi:hypothetical protein